MKLSSGAYLLPRTCVSLRQDESGRAYSVSLLMEFHLSYILQREGQQTSEDEEGETCRRTFGNPPSAMEGMPSNTHGEFGPSCKRFFV